MEDYPPLPSRIGKVTKRAAIDGSPMEYTVVDEITRMPASTPGKAIYLQLLRFANGREELRLCYYMIAHRPRAKGKWAFGQFATMIAREDFEALIVEAKLRGWISKDV